MYDENYQTTAGKTRNLFGQQVLNYKYSALDFIIIYPPTPVRNNAKQ